jgi:hypothetical protein
MSHQLGLKEPFDQDLEKRLVGWQADVEHALGLLKPKARALATSKHDYTNRAVSNKVQAGLLVAALLICCKELLNCDVLRRSNRRLLGGLLFVDDEGFKKLIYLHRVEQICLFLEAALHLGI